jgi:hypothetical protein
LAVAVGLVGADPTAAAETYTVTPETMPETLARLRPGDTMELDDGIYTKIHISGRHGEGDKPIKIRAVNERRALVKGDGVGAAVQIHRSSWWTIEGLHIENEDVEKHATLHGEDGMDSFAPPVTISASEHIVLRRNLCLRPNRWGNNQGVSLSGGSKYCLVEENELYDFHRNGYSAHGLETQFNIFRRNYANSRSTPRLGRSWGPNDAYVMYGGASNLLENNVAEFNTPDGICFANWGQGNRLLGNIALGGTRGFIVVQKNSTPRFVGDGCQLAHNLAIGCTLYGFLTGSVINVPVANGTAIGSGQNGINMADMRPDRRAIAAPPAVSMVNMLAVDNKGYGFQVRNPERFALRRIVYCAGWDNAKGTFAEGVESENPLRIEEAPPWPTPVVSPLRGAGLNGADVGATILYRYEGGMLTGVPLWDPATGEFPHGAVIEGVNDVAGRSLFDLHLRLNVSPATLPGAFGDGGIGG